MRREFPTFDIRRKVDSWFMQFISDFLRVITFGRMTSFMENFITTIGYTVYVPESWADLPDSQKYVILRHERVHMRQREKYGALWFTFLYLFFPLPAYVAYFRMKFECEAYAESMKATVVAYGDHAPMMLKAPAFKTMMVNHFTSAEYFWMWPHRAQIEEWFDEAVEEALSSG
jgi:hypothetical protein